MGNTKLGAAFVTSIAVGGPPSSARARTNRGQFDDRFLSGIRRRTTRRPTDVHSSVTSSHVWRPGVRWRDARPPMKPVLSCRTHTTSAYESTQQLPAQALPSWGPNHAVTVPQLSSKTPDQLLGIHWHALTSEKCTDSKLLDISWILPG